MIRAVSFLLPALLLIACGQDSDPTPEKEGQSGGTSSSAEPKTGNAPVTGSPVFRKDTEAIARDIGLLEKAGRPSEDDKLAAFKRDVRMKINHIDVTLAALEVSIAAEAKQIVETKHGTLLTQRRDLDKQIDGKWREITEIRELLSAADKGTDSIPAGFTEDELKDMRSALEEQVRALREKRDELNVELQKFVDMLNGGATFPSQGDTTLTKEREILLALKKRAEKLLAG